MRTWIGVRRLLAMATLGVAPTIAAQTSTGVIEGRVLETGSNRPLAGARVLVSGLAVGAVTTTAGTYRITGVPACQVELHVRLLGYTPGVRTLLVAAGQTATADFSLQVSALQLDAVIVTGSG